MAIISIKNISKKYQIGEFNTGTLSHDINKLFRKIFKKGDYKIEDENLKTEESNKVKYNMALEDVSFEVEKGDVIGVVGKNGAGKSTLLKILSKVTGPSSGIIEIEGRVASLLEVGTGFHPEMTGRENIYMNGTIMGMTKKEIDLKLEEIVSFADVSKYLDTPVKRYSSGMVVRLGFSVAAHLEPDILIVDEVLAVGDVDFQKKAIGKMKEVSSENQRTVLFVSHNLNSLRKLCNKGILLQNGRCTFKGSIDQVISKYITTSKDNYLSHEYTGKNNKKYPLFLKKAHLHASEKNSSISFFETKEPINISLSIEINYSTEKEHYGVVEVYNTFGENIIFSDTFDDNFSLDFLKKSKSVLLNLKIPGQILKVGEYVIFIHIGKWRVLDYKSGISDKILKFTVIDSNSRRAGSRRSVVSTIIPWEITIKN